jgi:uncharacterized protein YueI
MALQMPDYLWLEMHFTNVSNSEFFLNIYLIFNTRIKYIHT